VYGAYLKHLKKSAQTTMVLRSAEFLVNDNSHLVFNEDSNNLIKNADFEYIFLSYNNEGLMSENYIKNRMQKYGKYSLVKKEYQRIKAHKDINRKHKADKTFEYLHILQKN
jgi:adenine-specific DNA methylase